MRLGFRFIGISFPSYRLQPGNHIVTQLKTTISIEGPLSLTSHSLMLPLTERKIFSEVYHGILDGKSFVIHGPYQSGKTSFLWALDETLRKVPASTVLYLDMSDIPRNPSDAEEAFSMLVYVVHTRCIGQT